MNKITPLETKCLANMPVVLDAIATTIDTLFWCGSPPRRPSRRRRIPDGVFRQT